MTIEKTNEAVTYTAQATDNGYVFNADVKTSRDESTLLALNGVIRTAEGEYVGSFAAGENNSALNVNTSAPEQMSAIASLVADFTESLIAKA